MARIKGNRSSVQEARRIGTIASMVPDEIIYRHHDYSIRNYEAALMFIDVSGFTNLCENYTKVGRGGPSRLTQVLNSYIGAMVQEILTHNGDILKFSGDAFLSMWKKTARLTMQDVVHTAIDCGLLIQKNYGTFHTNIGVNLKVKVAISAGLTHFSILGGENQCSYVIVGQPVWDVKMAEYISTAGDVITSASAWMYVNEAEYCTLPLGDGRHTKVLGVGATWKRVENIHGSVGIDLQSFHKSAKPSGSVPGTSYREFSLRPSVIAAMRSTWWPGLRRFMVSPVLRAVDNDEPMEFLTEIRRVVIVFLNIITKTVTPKEMINTVNKAYRRVSSVTSTSGGLVNKISMFDKDMTFLVVFGLRGLKHEDETQNALLCASKLKETLNDENIINVSIGITSGTTYCGVVGHVLRREYTVIGTAVNKARKIIYDLTQYMKKEKEEGVKDVDKVYLRVANATGVSQRTVQRIATEGNISGLLSAARLMMAYPNKVTCDKETFLRSKISQEHFRLMEIKPLKGIAKPGPIYEFNTSGWPENIKDFRHPMIGRDEEVQKYKSVLQNAIYQKHERFTRFKDHKFAIAFIGPKWIGKTRLVKECLSITPNFVRIEKITLTESDKATYGLFHLILLKIVMRANKGSFRSAIENRIRYSLNTSSLTPFQIHALNTVFDIRFPLPENFTYSGDFLKDLSVRNVLLDFFKSNFAETWVIAVDEIHHADNESWRLLIIMLESKSFFIIMTLIDEEILSPVAKLCFLNEMIVKINLSGIDRLYHAALACQLLDVQAIPADLEKVIESASDGAPGWIQNFLISLVQRGALSVVTVTRNEAQAAGAVMPLTTLLQKSDHVINLSTSTETSRLHSYQSILCMSNAQAGKFNTPDTENVQMAVLADSYNFDNIKMDLSMDAIILKTYDSLTPFQKLLLKCGSVLGDVFSRRMLLYLLQNDSTRKVAKAHCRDLPMYAFCGYMRFRHSLFRTTTYELLTESQKLEMHARALLYLERYTRRCLSCGAGCFTKLLGLRIDDGLKIESEAMKRTRQQILALGAETRDVSGPEPSSSFINETRPAQLNLQFDLLNYNQWDTEDILFSRILETRNSELLQHAVYGESKRVRSFSGLQTSKCECLSILLFVYSQIIDHCRGAGEDDKLREAYMEYADLSTQNNNIPQAIRLLFEVENVITNKPGVNEKKHKNWIHQFHLASIYSLRGLCMLESGDLKEAKKLLFHAMKLYYTPFPTSKYGVKLRSFQASFRLLMAFCVAPHRYVATESGVPGYFYEGIADTLSILYRLFTENKEDENAMLAVKWSLNCALRTNSNLRVLCLCYGNMIAIYRRKQKYSLCLKLENSVSELIHRKRGQLDITEVQAVGHLYTNMFLCHVENGNRKVGLEYGFSVMHMMPNINLYTRQVILLWMLRLLLSDLRIHDMVAMMREFFYITDQYDLSSESWYHFYSMVILLDTGYCVESYNDCEKFYIKKGDTMLRARTPEAAGSFLVCMWLATIRMEAWEKSILWEEKIKHLINVKFHINEFNTMILIRIIEGFLISLVQEMDKKDVTKINVFKRAIKKMFRHMKSACTHAPMYFPRFYLLLAYNYYIEGKKQNAFNNLKKARDSAKYYSNRVISVWVEHTLNHWQKKLSPKLEYYWMEHMQPDKLLDYRDFDFDNVTLIPYTLPLPQDLDI